MPPCGTFEYVVHVPSYDVESGRSWPASVRVPVPIRGSDLLDDRLTGLAPTFSISDGDTILCGGGSNVPVPDVPRSKITLTASARERSRVRTASFHVATALAELLLPDDVIELTRTRRGGLGLAVLRAGRLLVAAGAISQVPLGIDVRASVVELGTARNSGTALPIEVGIGRESHRLSNGSLRIGGYELFVAHGVLRGIPGTDECAALARIGDCSPAAANATAVLLRYGWLELVKWEAGADRRRHRVRS